VRSDIFDVGSADGLAWRIDIFAIMNKQIDKITVCK